MNVSMSPSTIEPRSPMLRKATIGNSFSFSLKKVRAIRKGKAQNFFQCKSCLFAEVSNRSHAGKAVAKFNVINYNYNLSKLSATFKVIKLVLDFIIGDIADPNLVYRCQFDSH